MARHCRLLVAERVKSQGRFQKNGTSGCQEAEAFQQLSEPSAASRRRMLCRKQTPASAFHDTAGFRPEASQYFAGAVRHRARDRVMHWRGDFACAQLPRKIAAQIIFCAAVPGPRDNPVPHTRTGRHGPPGRWPRSRFCPARGRSTHSGRAFWWPASWR